MRKIEADSANYWTSIRGPNCKKNKIKNEILKLFAHMHT